MYLYRIKVLTKKTSIKAQILAASRAQIQIFFNQWIM